MRPEIYLFGLSFPTYGMIAFAGLLVCAAVSVVLLRRRNINSSDFLFTTVAVAVGLLAGSHLLYALTRSAEIAQVIKNYGEYSSFASFFEDFIRYFSGMVFYGGLYGGLLFGVLFAKKKKYPVREMTDVFAVLVPLFHVFGRVGCFFAGCCYGVKWQYGISGRVIVGDVKEYAKRLPIQLVEAGMLLVIFSVMLWLFAKNKCRQKLIFVYLCTYAVIRFVLEFFRGDEVRGFFLTLSTSQWISILTLVWVGVYLVASKKKSKI